MGGSVENPQKLSAEITPRRNASTVLLVLTGLVFLAFSIIFYVEAAGYHVFNSLGAAAAWTTAFTTFFFIFVWWGFDVFQAWFWAKKDATLEERQLFGGAYEHLPDNLRLNRAAKWAVFFLWIFVLIVLWTSVHRYGFHTDPHDYIYGQNNLNTAQDGFLANPNSTANCTLVPRQWVNVGDEDAAVPGLEDLFTALDAPLPPDSYLIPDRCGQLVQVWRDSSLWLAVILLLSTFAIFSAIVPYQHNIAYSSSRFLKSNKAS